jgi:hypothetical protein
MSLGVAPTSASSNMSQLFRTTSAGPMTAPATFGSLPGLQSLSSSQPQPLSLFSSSTAFTATDPSPWMLDGVSDTPSLFGGAGGLPFALPMNQRGVSAPADVPLPHFDVGGEHGMAGGLPSLFHDADAYPMLFPSLGAAPLPWSNDATTLFPYADVQPPM